RNEQTAIVAAPLGGRVRCLPLAHLELRPFSPEVHARRGLDEISDVRAPDACGSFEEVHAPIALAADELGVRDTSHDAEVLDNTLMHVEDLLLESAAARDRPRREDATRLPHLEERLLVRVNFREDDLALGDDRIDMENVSRDHALDEVVRLRVA